MHSTDNLDDGYVGSGKRLWYSINKHGKENHKTEILEYLSNRNSLKLREEEIVNEELLKNDLCMNLTKGGRGSWEYANDPEYDNPTHRIGFLKNISPFTKYDARHYEIIRAGSIKGVQKYKELCEKHGGRWFETPGFGGMKHTKSTKQKMSNAKKGKYTGAGNSQYGTCWIYSEVEKLNKKIDKNDLYNYMNCGWKQGRKMKF